MTICLLCVTVAALVVLIVIMPDPHDIRIWPARCDNLSIPEVEVLRTTVLRLLPRDGGTVVVLDHTVQGMLPRSMPPPSEGRISEELIDLHYQTNITRYNLRRLFNTVDRARPISAAELEELHAGTLWRLLEERCPDVVRLLRVSKPCFTNDGARAIIYLHYCQKSSRDGSRNCYLLFENVAGEWVWKDVLYPTAAYDKYMNEE